MSVRIDKGALNRVVVDIRTQERRVKNMTPMWRKVGSYIAAVNRRQFATEGAYLGKPWKPLKPEYLQWKVKAGYSKKTLVQTGSMRATFVSRPMLVEQYANKSALFGSTHPLAPYHQYGTHRNGKPAIPARPIIVANAKLARDIGDIIVEYVSNRSATTIRKYI